METIFIIRAISSDWDVDDWCVGWVETEELAKNKAKHKNEVLELSEKYKTLIREHRSSLYDIVPQEETEEIPHYPKWAEVWVDELRLSEFNKKPEGISQKDITKEMRDERNRIIQLQKEIGERNDVKYKKRQEKIDELSQKYIDSLNISSEVLDEMKVEYVSSYDWYELEKL